MESAMVSTKEILKNNNVKKLNNNAKKLKNNAKKLKNNNVNVSSNVLNKLSNNVNKHRIAEDTAKRLVTELSSPQSYKLFCKVAYMNTESLIWGCVGEVKERQAIRNPAGYFIPS